MEPMDLAIATVRDTTYMLVNHPFYSFLGVIVIFLSLIHFYCRLTLGICDSDEQLTGKTVFITGATAGIGKSTALDLARRQARVLIGCRDLEKGRRVADEIVAETGNRNVVVKLIDLCSFESVRSCAKDVLENETHLHILINNAGAFVDKRETTIDGCEKTMQSNHLGHFLFTLLLLDLIKKSAPSRIINVSSAAYRMAKLNLDDLHIKNTKYSSLTAYCNSKLANIFFTRELALKLTGTGVTVNALHPGVVKTDILKSISSFFELVSTVIQKLCGKSSMEGAQTTIYLAVHSKAGTVTGKYFVDCKEEALQDSALNEKRAKQLWEISEEIVGVSFK